MITDALVHFMCGLFRGILALIPPWSPSLDGLHAAGLAVGQVVGMLDNYIPVTVLVSCLVAVIGFKLALMLWYVVVFVYDRFPLKFT